MRRIKTRTLWITIAVAFLLAIGLIVACTQAKGNWTKVIIVLLAVDFIYLTVAVQMASYKTFRYRAKPVKYPTKDFEGDFDRIRGNLQKKGYKERKTPYGGSFLKVIGDTAYKCVLVEHTDKYFNQEQEEQTSPVNRDLEKCTRFIGLEIFYNIDEANLVKLPDFSLSGKNIYYTALLYQENRLFKCLNYVEPQDGFKEGFDTLLQHIEIKEIISAEAEAQEPLKN